MDNIIVLCGCCAAFMTVLTLLRQYKKEYAVLCIILFGITVLIKLLPLLSESLSLIKTLFEQAGATEYSKIIFKTLFISFIVETSAELCRDAGENSVASKLELAGKIEILLLSIPLVKKIAEISKTLVS